VGGIAPKSSHVIWMIRDLSQSRFKKSLNKGMLFFPSIFNIDAKFPLCLLDCFDCVSFTVMLCYASFSWSGVPPDTEVELRLCFSLRGQIRTKHWTNYRSLVQYLHVVMMAVGLMFLLWVFIGGNGKQRGIFIDAGVRLDLWNWKRV